MAKTKEALRRLRRGPISSGAFKGAILVASAATATVLSAGEAKAQFQQRCYVGPVALGALPSCLNIGPITDGDKILDLEESPNPNFYSVGVGTPLSEGIGPGNLPESLSGILSWGFTANQDLYSTELSLGLVNANNVLVGAFNQIGVLEYTVQTTTGLETITGVRLDSNVIGEGNASVTKSTFANDFDNIVLSSLTSADGANSPGPGQEFDPLNPDQSIIYLRDVWDSDQDSAITTISNNITQEPFQAAVPGPLPIFGAAAAFGTSRRIRSRIKARYLFSSTGV
jgi:hypothetical protein